MSIRKNTTKVLFLRQKQSGFTLVELSIVLAVIGLIIGAMAIGKDVQRNAEFTKVKNKFVDQWEQAYNQHYQRTGVVVGDDQIAPRIMVNGTNYGTVAAALSGTTLSGGNMAGVTPPGRVCDKAEGSGMLARGAADTTLRTQMTQAGVRLPPGRAEGFEDRYVYLDSNGNPQEIQVCFQWNRPGSADGSGNVMILSGLTPDLARMLDQMVDGKPDAQEGRFRLQGVVNGTPNAPGIQWNRTNDDSIASAGGASTSTGNALRQDEAQVVTVVAIYQMNQ